MSRSLEGPPARWNPLQFGHSIPIDVGLRRWRLVFAAVVLLGLVAVVITYLSGTGFGGGAAEQAGDPGRLVADYLKGVEIAPWDPGAPLLPTALPPYLSSPPPALWDGGHPGDPPPADPERAAEGRNLFEQEVYVQAATVFQRLAKETRNSWSLYYNAAVALDRAGAQTQAAEELGLALARLNAYEKEYGEDPRHQAAMVATRYAAGSVLLKEDCIQSIRHLKLAVRALRSFVDVEGAMVFDRRLPFQVTPALQNHDVWNRLAEGYFACEGKYPDEYFAQWGGGQKFEDAEEENLKGIEAGPFPNELGTCIEAGGKTSRCWALSNLHGVYFAIRELFPDDGSAPTHFQEGLASLTRLIYNMALLGAEGEDQAKALRFLQLAATLDRAGKLEREVTDLGRYLAAETRNYSILAAPYRGRRPEDLPLDATSSPEEVKGMAWALSESWQQALRSGQPQEMIGEVDEAIHRVPGEFVDSLTEWKRGVQLQLRDALAEAMDIERRRDVSAAMAIRDVRAPYLGEEWPRRAMWTWWSRVAVDLLKLVSLFVLILLAMRAVGRYVVYPYLLYTTDYYRTEFQRRHEERRRKDLPFTGREIAQWGRDRDRN